MVRERFKPAEVFPPGEYLRDELKERGWTQVDFARVIGRPLQAVNEIINGKKRITAETAKAIALAFGTSPELWLNMQTYYDLHTVSDADPKIEKRAAELAHSR
ncbi:MAG: HigA family addiction module antitoxin [Tepidisphaeraceae bacterium]|jgi:HTH-type transcriptional regulator/antitoxin HigA